MRVRQGLLMCLGLLALAPLSAANAPYIYDLDSPVYQDVESLFILQGKALPSLAHPWSQDQVEFLLDKLDQNAFSESEKLLFARIQSYAPEPKAFQLTANINPELYLHSNTEFDDSNDWVLTYEKRKPFIDVSLESSLNSYFYGFASFPTFRAAKSRFDGKKDDPSTYDDWNSYWLGKHYLDSNSVFFFNEDVSYDANFPVRAFLSLGGKGWNFEMGRDRLDWGAGESGNMVLDSHVQYHNMLRFTAYQKHFTYTFVSSFFPDPEEVEAARNYHDKDDGEADPWDESSPMKGLKMFMAHRFEFRFLDDKIGFAATEGIMYQPQDNELDLRVLNPMMFFHNYYIDSDANSIVQFDLDWTFLPGWNVYAQFVIDEMRFVVTESATSSTVHPDAFGFLGGVKNVTLFGKGVLRSSAEVAFTYPYLYLRTQESSYDNDDAYKGHEGDTRYDSNNFIIAIRRWVDGDLQYDWQNMGYPYSGDAFVFQAKSTYRVGDWSLSGLLFYMVHGTKWMEGDVYGENGNSYWIKGPKEYKKKTPYGGWDTAIRRLIIGVSGDKQITPRLKTYGEVDFTHVANKENIHGNDEWDVQCGVGLSYRFF